MAGPQNNGATLQVGSGDDRTPVGVHEGLSCSACHLSYGHWERIAGMLHKGRESARVLRRALILRQLDQGQTAAQVAGNVGVAAKTVRAIARRCEEEGLESALYDKPRPGQPRVLDAGQSQRIIALVCGPPPEGQARWSVRLIAQEAVKRKLAPKVGRETIRVLLESHDLRPWRGNNVVVRRDKPAWDRG